jgi:hypothetical protein
LKISVRHGYTARATLTDFSSLGSSRGAEGCEQLSIEVTLQSATTRPYQLLHQLLLTPPPISTMQLRSIVFTTALAVAIAFAPNANAAECTKEQMKEMDKLEDDPAMDKACPDNGGSGSFDFETVDPKAWAKASPCKDTACVTYLKAQVAKMPNCEIEKVNMKTVYEDKLTLCVDIASGKLSAAEIEKRVGNLTTVLFGSGSGDMDDWDFDGSDFHDKHKKHMSKKTITANSTANSTTPTTTPTPTPKKSGATTVAITTGAVFIAATVASLTAA